MIVGVDVGTTSVKGLVLDREARVLGTAEHAHDLSNPRPSWAEERPEDWWEGVRHVLRALLGALPGEPVEAVGVSGMVPAVVLLDEDGRPVRPSIQQNDARASEEVAWFAQRFDEDELFSKTGATWNQQLVAPKLRWVQHHEPAAWARVARITGSYEYVTERLGADPYVESNWALESGLWSAVERRWLGDVMDAAGITDRLLRPVKSASEFVGAVARRAAEETGLPQGTPLIAGSADHIAAAFAAGLASPGDVVMKFGGAGDFLYATDAFAPVRQLFIDYHDVPDRFVVNGCMASSGSLVKWFQTQFAPDRSFAELDAMASAVDAGSDGLVVLPYFLGEKTPLHDPFARGTLVGLTLAHTVGHLHRAVLEGVAFAFRHHLEVLLEAGYPVGRVYMMDGGAKSALWRGILASVLGREVVHLHGGESGSALGVALLAGVSAGHWSWNDVPGLVEPEGVTQPDPRAVPRYGELYGIYRDIYRQLRSVYPRLLEAARA